MIIWKKFINWLKSKFKKDNEKDNLLYLIRTDDEYEKLI